MQLYTKILIGMVAGALIGLLLGPRSALLDHDLYVVDRAAQVDLRVGPGPDSAPLPVPPAAALSLRRLELRHEMRSDARGESHHIPVAARVRLRYDARLALLDQANELRAHARAGDDGEPVIVAWLMLKPVPLPDGGFVTWPQPQSHIGHQVVRWLSPVGKLFMRLIKMVIVPLVFTSLLVGVAGLGDVRKLGRLGGRTLALYLATTAVAVCLGLLMAHVLAPGRHVDPRDQALLRAQYEAAAGDRATAAARAPSMIDNLLAIVPENPLASLASGDMLQVIFFAILFGVALTLVKQDSARQVVAFMDAAQHAMIWIIHIVMKVAPYGVAALIAEVVGQSGWTVLKALLVYALAVLLGLVLHVFIVYGALVKLWARLPLRAFLRAIRPAQLIAFSTSSSSATLPVSMECAEKRLGISNGVASFVIPLGSTVNMDGTALYQGVAAIFIAQVFGLNLSFGAELGIVLTATAASIGAAGVPGAGMITLAMVLMAADIPAVGVALILGVDRILDMFRTTVNVTGDLAVTAAMAVSEGERPQVAAAPLDRVPPQHPVEPDGASR